MHVRRAAVLRTGLLAVIGQLVVRALVVGAALVVAPSGELVGLSTDVLRGTPFSNFPVPGFVLAGFLGLYLTVVWYSLYTKRKWGWVGAVSVAVVLSVWVAAELGVGFDGPTTYLNLLTVVAILVLAVHPSVRHPDRQTGGW